MTLNNPILVGRADELEVLRRLGSTVAGGTPAAAVILAEPGIGKSRLLTEAAARIRLPALRVQGSTNRREIALAAMGGVIRELTKAPFAGGRLEAIVLGETTASRTFETVRLFELAFRCLRELGPRAILVDDLQWVDTQSLALLEYLVAASQGDHAPLLLICAGRPAPETEPFAATLADHLSPGSFARIRLGPLAQADARSLVAQLAPSLDRDAADRLWQRAQGSPFWLGVLASEHGATPDPGHLIQSRWAGLDFDTGRLFALLLVAGEPLTDGNAAELLGWDQRRAQLAARNLANRGLVLLDGAVRIAHDLIRESALVGLPSSERATLHRRLAEWLESFASNDVLVLSRALEHRRAAGLPSADLALRIARSPGRRLLGRAGLSMLGAVADEADGVVGEELRATIAQLATELGAWDVALARWADLAGHLPASLSRADVELAAATAAFRLGHSAEVHDFARRARADAMGDRRISIDADSLEFQAANWLEGRPVDAQPLLDRAIETGTALVDSAGGVDALDDLACDAYVRALRAKLDAAIRRADAETVAACAEVIERSARDPAEVQAAASDAIFSVLQFEGLPGQAEMRAERALSEARRLLLPSAEVEATHWAGWIAQHRGRLDGAAELLDQSIALAERVGPPRRFTLAQLRAIREGVEASRGDWRDAVTGIERALRAEANPHYRLVIRTIHLWVLGRFATAGVARLEDVVAQAMPDVDAAGCDRCHWDVVLHAAEASARLGPADLARSLSQAWDASHPRPRPGHRARRAYVAALILSAEDPSEGLTRFDDADRLAEAAGHDLMRLWIALDRAVALARVDRDSGIAALWEVGSRAVAMGARSERELALRELRANGVRTWQRGRRMDAGELSERERQIAELVAGGASNPEIAAALFVSRKTVERHVSNVLATLGARNRAELAARLARKDEGVRR